MKTEQQICRGQTIRYIMDESYGSTNNAFITSWVELQAIDGAGMNHAVHKLVKANFKPNRDVTGQASLDTITNNHITLSEWVSASIVSEPVKIIVDLGTPLQITTIKIYHGWWTKRAYKNNVYVSLDGKSWKSVYLFNASEPVFETIGQPLCIPL